jgi:hypothetical protein
VCRCAPSRAGSQHATHANPAIHGSEAVAAPHQRTNAALHLDDGATHSSLRHFHVGRRQGAPDNAKSHKWLDPPFGTQESARTAVRTMAIGPKQTVPAKPRHPCMQFCTLPSNHLGPTSSTPGIMRKSMYPNHGVKTQHIVPGCGYIVPQSNGVK